MKKCMCRWPLSLTNQISAYQIQKVESSQRCLYGAFWLVGEIPRDGDYEGRLHMTYFLPLSDLSYDYNEDMYFNQTG